jgi:hypothetical protein
VGGVSGTFGICGPLLHEQEEVAGCSIGKTERRLYEKDCFFKLKEYPEGNGHDTGGFREWIL